MRTAADTCPLVPPAVAAVERHPRALAVPAALLVAALIALVDYAVGQTLSCTLFYLVPVAVAAWWGGQPAGLLLAIAGAVLGHLVRQAHGPDIPFAAQL